MFVITEVTIFRFTLRERCTKNEHSSVEAPWRGVSAQNVEQRLEAQIIV
jgi:hypothetical protein